MTTATKARPRDKYDEAIEYLTAHPDEILLAWSDRPGDQHPHHCLFIYANASGEFSSRGFLGCLTQIRSGGPWRAETSELTAAIAADDRLPDHWDGITPNDLPVFAEWQRRLDREIRGGGA